MTHTFKQPLSKTADHFHLQKRLVRWWPEGLAGETSVPDKRNKLASFHLRLRFFHYLPQKATHLPSISPEYF